MITARRNIHRLWKVCAVLLCCLAAWASAETKRELVFLTWEEYIDPAVLAEFEREQNCTVRRVYFDDDDERNMMLANTDATGFDVVTVDHVMLDAYRKREWLLPLTYAKVPNARHARDPWKNEAATEPFYSVSYTWGGVGIIYRKDKLKQPPTRWRDLFQPAPELQGHIMMLDTVQTAYGLALMSLGFPFNSTDPAQVNEATQALMKVRPYVFAFRNIRLGADSELLAEPVYAAITYNGDAIVQMEYSDTLAFVFPEDGIPLWLDTNVVLKKTSQPALAQAFLDFLNRPDIAARNALVIKYATTNIEALKLLPGAFLQDKRIFPDRSTMSHNQLYELLPTDHMRRITAQMVQIMAR